MQVEPPAKSVISFDTISGWHQWMILTYQNKKEVPRIIFKFAFNWLQLDHPPTNSAWWKTAQQSAVDQVYYPLHKENKCIGGVICQTLGA